MAPAQPQSQGRQSILPLFPLLSSHQLATRLDASIQLLATLPLQGAPVTDSDTPYALKRLIAGLASNNDAARQGFAVALAQLVALLPDDKAAQVLPQLFEMTTSKAGMDNREERDLLFARLMGLHALVRSGVLLRAGEQVSKNGEAWQEVVGALVGLGNKKTWIREPAYWVVCGALRALLASDAAFKDECIKWAVQRLVNDAREKAKGWGPEKVAIVLVLQAAGVKADWSSVLAPTFASGSLLARSSLPALASALKGSVASSSAPEPSTSSGPKQGVNATKTSKGAAAPAPGQAPHFVWTLLRDAYFPAEGAKVDAAYAKFGDFWRVCVDLALFASPSLPLKSLGFSLISLFLPSVPPSELPSLLANANTLRTFANHLRGSSTTTGGERTLSRVADKLATSTLPAYLSTAPTAALPLLKTLTGPPHSNHNAFEVKMLERVVARLPLQGVKGWIAYLQSMVLSPSEAQSEDGEDVAMAVDEDEKLEPAEKEKRITAQRIWALDQLLHVGKNGGVEKDEEAVRGLLEFLAVVGWFEVTKEGSKGARSYIPTPAFTSSQRLAARSRFFSVLTALVSAVPSTSSSTPTTPTLAGGPAWLSRALALLDNLAADSKHFSRASVDGDDEDDEDDSEGKELVDRVKALHAALAPSSSSSSAAPAEQPEKKGKKARKSVDAASSSSAAPASAKEEERKTVARALCEGVRLVAWDEGAEDAAEVLESTADAVTALFPALAAAVPAKASADDEDDDENEEAPESTTILVDLLLALLRRPSAFVKAVAGVVLKGFAEEVGEQAVELLVEQWRVEEEEVEEATEGEDAEMADGEEKKREKKGKKAAEAEVSDEEGDEDDSDDEEGFEVDEAFKNELLAALEAGGMHVPDAITGEENEEESSDEEEGEGKEAKEGSDEEEILDDDAMLELDERLADIFRANGGGRRSKKRDRTDSLHYRLRCLDLVDVLAHHAPSSLLVPTLVPLFNLVRTATPVEAELQNKTAKLLRFLVQPRKSSSPSSSATASSVSADTALEAFEELHRIASSVESGDLAPLCAQVALALVRSAVASSPSTAASSISRIAAASFEAYLTTKNAKTKCQPLLMSELAKKAPTAVWEAREKLLELAQGEKVNAYRKVQAFEVVQTLVTSYAGSKTPESKTALLAFLPSYSAALYSTVSSSLSASSAGAPGSLDATRLKLLAKHALSSARLSVQLSSQSDAAVVWKPQQWAALLDPAQGKVSDRFKGATGVLGLVKQLVGVLGGDTGVGAAKKDKKRKAVDAPSAAAPEAVSTPNGKLKKAKKATGSTPASKPEEEVKDESAVDKAVNGGEAGEGMPSGKKGKKEKKRRRESGASRRHPRTLSTPRRRLSGPPAPDHLPPSSAVQSVIISHTPKLSVAAGSGYATPAANHDSLYPPAFGTPSGRKASDGYRLEQVRERWLGRRENRTRCLVILAAVVLLVWFAVVRTLHLRYQPPVPCDALHEPGRLLINLTSPLHTYWRPLDEKQCPPLPKYLPSLWDLTHGDERGYPQYQAAVFSKEYQLIAAEPLPRPPTPPPGSKPLPPSKPEDPIPFLRKRRRSPPTVLVIGDSVDRNGLVHFCQLFRRNVTISHYHDIRRHPPGPYPQDLTKGHGPKFDGWDQRGLMHKCELPYADGSGTAMRVVNGFHYGMDALDEFNTPDHTDWHAPGRIENRIDELIVPAVEQMGGTDKVDVVQIHSGMWDLALFGMQDDKTRWSLTVPLTPEQLAWWQERMRHTIFHIRQRFPKARLVFRKLHRTDDAVAGTQYITNLYVLSFPPRAARNPFLRVHQLRHLQEQVARSEGLPIFDFGHVLEGYQYFQEKVHPLLVPGGVVYAHNLVHQLRLALESRESWRKGWLWDA
ncbi:hypothetical protein JCM8547_004518 [Rhodosporidiobolus lusitaniae]